MSQAQAPVIESFSQNGRLVCSNLVPGSVAAVEWASAPSGPWSTNWAALQAITVSAGGTIDVSVPMFYRVRGAARGAPTVSTLTPSVTGPTAASLQGSANPNGSPTTAWFRYSSSNPGVASDTFGTRVPASGGVNLGAGSTPQSFSQAISGLLPGVTYYYCAIAQNAQGTGFGTIQSFTAPGSPPTVTTATASDRTGTTATLNGTVNPSGLSSVGWFRYSTSSPGTANDSFGLRVPASGGVNLGAGNGSVAFSQAIGGLSPGTTYFYCAIAQNASGTGFGTLQTFFAPLPPTASTLAASGLSGSSATLNGSGNPNGASAVGWFRYSAANPGVASDTFGTRVPASGGSSLGAGVAAQNFSQVVSGLTPGTTYYYCAIVLSAEGLAFGAIQTFAAPIVAPTVTTGSATGRTPTNATLNGTANPNGDPTTAWFRYSTTSPGVPNDVFGTRTPASGGSAVGAGTSSAAFSQTISGLTPGTSYFYCAVARNNGGTNFGSLQLLTTPFPPNVTTVAPANVTSTTALLRGIGNPNGTSATGWFRYSTSNPGSASDSAGSRVPAAGGVNLGAGTTPQTFSQTVTNLSPGTTYYVWALAQNVDGLTPGNILTFTTP